MVNSRVDRWHATLRGERSRTLLRHFTKLVCLATLCLIFLGGQVKSHEAGLAVPDWPLTFGQNPITFPVSDWTGNIFYEHLHRLVAGSVGVLMLILAGWLGLAEERKWVRVLGYASLAAVVAQAVLGGLTVIFMLPTAISVGHGVLAQTFFVFTVVLAYSQSTERRQREERGPVESNNRIARAALFVMCAVFVQLILGAVMRHTESGLAIPDFPTTAGRVVPWVNADSLAWVNDWREEVSWEEGADLPPVTMSQVVFHFIHRVGAVFVVLLTIIVVVQGMRQADVAGGGTGTAYIVGFLVALQLCLGALTVWTMKSPLVTSIHVVGGAAILGMSTLLVLRTHGLSLRKTERAIRDGDLKSVSTSAPIR